MMRRKKALGVTLILLLTAMLAWVFYIHPAKASQYADNITVDSIFSDVSVAYLGDIVHLAVVIQNTGQIGHNYSTPFRYWWVSSVAMSQFLAANGTPPSNKPYWHGWETFVVNLVLPPNATCVDFSTFYFEPETPPGNYFLVFEFPWEDDFTHDNSPFHSESMWPGLYTVIEVRSPLPPPPTPGGAGIRLSNCVC